MSRGEPAASPFRDLSNLRTPRPNPNDVPPSPQFFTASKTPLHAPTPTPRGRRRPGNGAPTLTPLGRRLRAFEVDQSRSARRAESGRERALRAFAASASSWLSLLLRDPSACGCSPAVTGSAAAAQPCAAGKRGALDGERPRGGRSPKRHRGAGDRCGERRKEMTPAMVAALREYLREACSLEDVTERMENYMSKGACEEVLFMMFQICKVRNFRGFKLYGFGI
jgi:abnormal spindle-like microcephaly-associated protein